MHPGKSGGELAALRGELTTYIESVEQLEDDNEALRLQLLEERAQVKETFLAAKASWRQQSMGFAERERKRAEAGQHVGQELARARFDCVVLQTQAEAVLRGLLGAATNPVLLDLDTQDCCISVCNPLQVAVDMHGHSIHFMLSSSSGSGRAIKYPFAENTTLQPGASLTVFWSNPNQHLQHPEGNCYFWAAPAADVLCGGAAVVATLVKAGKELSRVSSVTSGTAPAPASAGGPSSGPSAGDPAPGTKRKRSDSGDSTPTATTNITTSSTSSSSSSSSSSGKGEEAVRPRLLGRCHGPLLLASALFDTHSGQAAILLCNRGSSLCRATKWVLELQGVRCTHLQLPDFEVPPQASVVLCSSLAAAESAHKAPGFHESVAAESDRQAVLVPALEQGKGKYSCLTSVHLQNGSCASADSGGAQCRRVASCSYSGSGSGGAIHMVDLASGPAANGCVVM